MNGRKHGKHDVEVLPVAEVVVVSAHESELGLLLLLSRDEDLVLLLKLEEAVFNAAG